MITPRAREANRLARRASAAIAFGITSLAAATLTGRASAAESDGLYGRFDGDLTLHAGAGLALMKSGPGLAARLEALYLSSAGIYGHYADALGDQHADVARSIAVGLTLEPLFLGRFATDLERGPARLDLFVDSLALQLGAFWHAGSPSAGGSFADVPGVELALAMGFPLFADATGPYIDVRAALRWRSVDLRSYAPEGANLFDRGAVLSVSLAWHHVIAAHIVDAGDRASR